MMDDPRFPGAPPGSYLSEEGWLIIEEDGGQAWTELEWNTTQDKPRGSTHRSSVLTRRRKRDFERRRRAAA